MLTQRGKALEMKTRSPEKFTDVERCDGADEDSVPRHDDQKQGTMMKE